MRRNGQPVAGFGVEALWSPTWRDPGAKLAAMDRLVADGRGDDLVEGGGCTEPGGGIVPTRRTARAMAAILRGQVDAGLGNPSPHHPHPHQDAPTAPAHISPWGEAIVASVVGAATGWVMEAVARAFRKRGRR